MQVFDKWLGSCLRRVIRTRIPNLQQSRVPIPGVHRRTATTGERMSTFTDNDTAFWKIGKVKTPNGGDGRKGYDVGNVLSSLYLKCLTGSRRIVGLLSLTQMDGSERFIRIRLGSWGKIHSSAIDKRF